MPMRATTVRFGDELWRLLELEAQREGVSAAQFIREATIMRVAYAMGTRGDPEFRDALAQAGAGGLPAERARPRSALDEVVAAVKVPARLHALQATGQLDSGPSPAFDRLASLAARLLDAPVALVSLVAEDRQYFKSCLGLSEPWASKRETPLSHSFCQHVVARRAPLIVDDAREDAVLADNPAIQDLGVVAYAGVPLIDARDQALGTLCVIDHRPRHWTRDQVAILSDIAASVVTEMRFTAGETTSKPA